MFSIIAPLSPRAQARRYNQYGYDILGAMRINPSLAPAFERLHEEGSCFLDIGASLRHMQFYLPNNTYHIVNVARASNISMQYPPREFRLRAGVKTSFEDADAQEWQGEAAAFDAALFAFSLTCMGHPSRAVKNAWQATREGGRLIIFDYLDSIDRRAPQWFIRRSAGYNPRQRIEEIVGNLPLRLLSKKRFSTKRPLLPDATLLVYCT